MLRRLDRLAVEPRPHLLPLPAPGPVACQQAAQQQRHVGVESLGQRHALRQGVNQERAVVDTIEAGAGSELLQEDDAEAPPVGRRRHAPEHGLGRHVACRLARGDHIQIELGEARSAEAGDHEIGGVGVAELDDLGPEIAMPQPDAGKPIEGPSDRLDDVAQGVLVIRTQGQVAQAGTVDVLDHLVRPLLPLPDREHLGHLLQPALPQLLVHVRVGLDAPRVERQHAALAAVHALDEVALGRTDGGERLDGAPAVYLQGRRGWRVCAIWRRRGLRPFILRTKWRLRTFAESRSGGLLHDLAAHGAQEVAGRHGVALTALARGVIGSRTGSVKTLRRQRVGRNS